MALTEAWRDLHRSRFPELTLDCGNTVDPGVIYSEDLRDWSDKATTPDQARMEQYIDRFDLRDMKILHIGIGDSGLAHRFHRRTKAIVGTTVDEPEMRVAQARPIANYTVVEHNKFSNSNDAISGNFDFILDNNPTSPCCCVRHLSDLFDLYVEKLASGGQVVTDQEGLGWVPDGANNRWRFDFDDLAATAKVAGLSAFRMTKTVYVLSEFEPAAAGLAPLSRHIVRRIAAFPRRAATKGPRALSRLLRSSIKRALLATVPWAVPARFKGGENEQ